MEFLASPICLRSMWVEVANPGVMVPPIWVRVPGYGVVYPRPYGGRGIELVSEGGREEMQTRKRDGRGCKCTV